MSNWSSNSLWLEFGFDGSGESAPRPNPSNGGHATMQAPPDIDFDVAIAALNYDVPQYWPGSGSFNITYSIPVAKSTWPGYLGSDDPPFRDGYDVLTKVEAARFRDAIAAYDEIIAPHFVETKDRANPGEIRVAITDLEPDGVWDVSYGAPGYGDPNAPEPVGDIWLDGEVLDPTLALGRDNFQNLLHEMGHSLGLKHSWDGTNQLPEEFNNHRYSLMAFHQPTDHFYVSAFAVGGGVGLRYEQVGFITPAIFDILALQARYGADPNTRAGNTTYNFDADAAQLQVIYDSGGSDTWDLRTHSRPSYIDLRPGAYSTIDYFSPDAQIQRAVDEFGEFYRGYFSEALTQSNVFTWTDNVGIAIGTIVENVLGGSADDILSGNDAANFLTGNGGNDALHGLNGNDTLSGGQGDDTLDGGEGADVLDGGLGADSINGGANADTYVYAAAESTGPQYDTLFGFDARAEHIDLPTPVDGIDAKITHGKLSAATFNKNMQKIVHAADLARHHAVLVTANSGNLSGEHFLVVEMNGRAGYQANQDLVLHLESAKFLDSLDADAFI